jgi:predicted dehydrogenase
MANVAIVGAGWGARVQAPTFRDTGLHVVGIARRTGWRDLITSREVDLVSIVTPPDTHREMTLVALEAGKHVLCEKPTALNAAEAEEMLEASRKRPDRVTLIDHELRFLPAWREARAHIEEIGPVRYVEVRYASPSRGDRSRAWNWWSDASQGGGIWGAVGSHFIDAVRYFGMEFESVQALMRTTIGERPFEGGLRQVTSDDFAVIHARLRGGPVAVMTLSAVSSGPDENSMLTIYGESGAMRFGGEEVLVSKGGSAWQRMAGGDMDKRPGNSPGGAFGTGTLHLARALREALDDGDRATLAPAATFEDGLAQQRVLDAARKSAQSGGWVTV